MRRDDGDPRPGHDAEAGRRAREKTLVAEHGLLGRSAAMERVRARIAAVARSNATVLLTGDSGTGKELAARAIHAQGARRDRPFVAVNCATFPEPLLASELFGHVRGAFTGAILGWILLEVLR